MFLFDTKNEMLFNSMYFTCKVYDKEVKSFVYSLEGTQATTKVQLPKDNSYPGMLNVNT